VIWIVWVLGTLVLVSAFSGLAGRMGKGWLYAIYAASIVIANVTASKLMVVAGLTVAAADIIYTIGVTTIELINECYGKEEADRAVVTAFFANVLWAFTAYVAVNLPPAPEFVELQPAFATVLGSAPRIVLASMIAYLAASRVDVWIYHRISGLGGPVLARIMVNNATSLFIDTILFSAIAFYGVFPLGRVIVGQYLVKIVISLVNVPFAYMARSIYERSGGEGATQASAQGGVSV